MIRPSICLSALVLAGLAGCGRKQAADETPLPPVTVTVIPGTAIWDVDRNRFPTEVSDPSGDFKWGHADATQRYLEPRNGALAAAVPWTKLDDIDLEFVKGANLSADRILDSDQNNALGVGMVVVFRTAEGRFGALEVVRYRPLHDLSFPAVSNLDEKTKKLVMDSPNIERYHLEIKWRLLD